MSARTTTTLHCDGVRGTGCPARAVWHSEAAGHAYVRMEAALEGWSFLRTTNGQRNITYVDCCDACTDEERKIRYGKQSGKA